MYIHQYLLEQLEAIQVTNKVLVIYGPRRIGKTTLLQKLLEKKSHYLFVSGEDIDIQRYLGSQSITQLQAFLGTHTLLVIDEGQHIPNIGLNLKLIVDHCPNVQVIATGSSSFDLANHVGEPLTGRKITLRMFPLSQMELGKIENLAQTTARLEERLIYGSYPEVILMPEYTAKKEYLHELTSSYLYKDIIALDGVRKSDKIQKILQLLAFQIGKEVSLSEIGQQVGLSKNTVAHYLDLLEKTFVLIRLQGFNRNLRKEVSKQPRYYFYDLGVRNAIVNQFNALELRNDVGQLWENYIIIERLKKQAYRQIWSNNYYWRTYSQQEIDWIEEREGKLFAYEMKWQLNKNVNMPSEWKKAYLDNSEFRVIHSGDYLDFIT